MTRFPARLIKTIAPFMGAFLLAFSGCSKKAPSADIPSVQIGAANVSKFTVANTLINAGIPAQYVHVPTLNYALPTRSWVTGDFAQRLRNYQSTLGDMGYAVGANDCTHFSRRACSLAAELFFHDPKRPPNVGLAFGEIFYIKMDGEGHSVNVIVVQGRTGPEVMFFEPQTCLEVRLTRDELANCGMALVVNRRNPGTSPRPL